MRMGQRVLCLATLGLSVLLCLGVGSTSAHNGAPFWTPKKVESKLVGRRGPVREYPNKLGARLEVAREGCVLARHGLGYGHETDCATFADLRAQARAFESIRRATCIGLGRPRAGGTFKHFRCTVSNAIPDTYTFVLHLVDAQGAMCAVYPTPFSTQPHLQAGVCYMLGTPL